ncbi:tyrosine-type recombinase/integrase [Parapusillimonas granuli]|uniref:Site-specific integrase n=1 Tax=Parapusillimonas granuli TaxID=380911 RepID=A0A853FYH0_9BURK|nr:site-specific integrase [Parapusillimonas granuli]MBB5217344.1 integrase [Parapusillimonas granuli]NYT47691.1 site-specific integrase [Parapusillimonas granuli]
MKLHITEKAVKEISVPEGTKHVLIFDMEQIGFAVQKTRTGNMSYIVMYRNELKKQRQEKLGKVGEISTNAARALARARVASIEEQKKGLPRGRPMVAPTMDEFFFKTFLPKVKLQSRSYETHSSIYRNHVQSVFGARRLNEIDGDEIVAYAGMLREKPVLGGRWDKTCTKRLAEGTVKRILILVRHIFNEAMRDKGNHVTENPTHAIQLTTVRKIVGKFLTRQQLASLLQAAGQSDNTDLPEIIKVMAATGLRRENVLAMRWAWFDSERATLGVPAEADKAKKGFVLHLSSGVLGILRRRLDESESEWVFPNPKTGLPYHSCRNAWVTARERAGLPGLRMHDLRHTYASMMLDSGSDIVDVQQALGHTQLKTTAGYLHLTEGRKRRNANAAATATGLFA